MKMIYQMNRHLDDTASYLCLIFSKNKTFETQIYGLSLEFH